MKRTALTCRLFNVLLISALLVSHFALAKWDEGTYPPKRSASAVSKNSAISTRDAVRDETANLAIVLSGPATVAANQPVNYKLVVTNHGPSYVNGAAVFVELPASMSVAGYSSSTSGGANLVNHSISGNKIWATVDIPPNGTDAVIINIDGYSGAAASTTTTATVSAPSGTTDPHVWNNSSSINTVVSASSGIDISLTGPASVSIGETISYIIDLVNSEPSDANGIAITDNIPSSLSNVTWEATVMGNAGVSATSGSGSVNITGNLGASSSGKISIRIAGTVSANAGATIINTASASNGITNASSSLTSHNTAVWLGLTGSAPTVIDAGHEIIWNMEVYLNGPNDANAAHFVAEVSHHVTNVTWEATPTGTATMAGAHTGSGNQVDLYANLPAGPGNKVLITITGTVGNVPPGTVIGMVSSVSSTDGRRNATPGAASSTLTTTVTVSHLTCDAPTSQTSSANSICVGCQVINPGKAVDSDSTTFSIMNMPASLLGGRLEQTWIFPAVASAGNAVTFVLEGPASMQPTDILGALQVSSFNGATSNNDHQMLNSSVNVEVEVRGTMVNVTFMPSASFDRIQLAFHGGLVNGFNLLNIYYATMRVPSPEVNVAPIDICAGTTATLTATVSPVSIVEWFDTPTGGAALPGGAGLNFTTPLLNGDKIYYAQAKRLSNGCANPVRTPVQVKILPAAVITQQPEPAVVWVNDNAAFTLTASGTDLSYRWQLKTGGNFVDLSNDAMYAGTTTSSLQITGATYAMMGNIYRCVVSSCSDLASSEVSLTVYKKEQTLSFDAQVNGGTVNKTYGDIAFDAGATATSGLTPVYASSNQNVATVDGSGQVTITGAGGTIITVFQPGNEVYVPATQISFTLQVAAKSISVTANAASKTYGDTDPALGYIASGFVNGEDKSVIAGALSRAAGEDAGVYVIGKGTLSAGNYSIDFTPADFTILKATQQITWQQSLSTGCNNETALTLSATSNSGLQVSYSVADLSIATVNGNTLNLIKPGRTLVTASQAGDNNHLPATSVSIELINNLATRISQRWSDVLVFDNTGNLYKDWKWYKNGNQQSVANVPYYTEAGGVSGTYYVIATKNNGEEVQTCPLTVTSGPVSKTLSIAPNPVRPGSTLSINCNFSASQLQGAKITIYNMAGTGTVVAQTTNVQPLTTMQAPTAQGLYVVTLLLANGQKHTVNLLVQ